MKLQNKKSSADKNRYQMPFIISIFPLMHSNFSVSQSLYIVVSVHVCAQATHMSGCLGLKEMREKLDFRASLHVSVGVCL